MSSYQFSLPFPPSVNQMWRSIVRGRFSKTILSKKARDYRTECLEILSQLNLKCIDEPVEISIVLHPKSNRRYDVDNFLKGPLDVLVHANVLSDDSIIQKLTVEKGEKIKDGEIVITIVKRSS